MHANANVYRQWLGIPCQERPLNCRELLGVPHDERDAAALEAAGLRRLAQIRPYMLKYPDEATALSNEVAGALNVGSPGTELEFAL